jgi:hypothetical protein
MDAESPIEIWDAPRRMRHAANKNPETKAPLYADWSIEAREGGTTTLRLVHSGFSASADWDEEFEAHARGWTLMLANLRHYFARHAKASAVHLPFATKVDMLREAVWTALVGKLALSSAPKVGQSHRIATAAGELTVKIDLVNHGRDLAFVVQDLDDALLRFSLEGGSKSPRTFVYGYVIAFGSSSARARELVTNMGALINSLAGSAGTGGPA